MESYSVQAILSAIDSGFTSTMNKAQSSLQGIDKGSEKAKTSIMDIAKGVGAFKLIQAGASTARASLDKAFSRIDTMEQFNRTMTRMTGSSEEANKALDRLSGATTGTAYGLDVAAKSTQDFVTRGMHIGDATRSVEGWMDAVAFYGKGTNEQLETVMDAIAKMRTKGTVEMEQLDRLFDAGIDAVGMYAQAVGRDSASVQEDLSARTISTNEFITVVEKAMREGTNGVQSVAGAAKEAGASWAGTFDNMKAATTRGMVTIIQEIDSGLTNGALPDMRTGLLDSAKTFESLLKVIGTSTGRAVKTAAPAIKSVADNLDIIGSTAVTAAAGYASFRTIMAAKDIFKSTVSSIKAANSAIKYIDATYGVLTVTLTASEKAERLRAAAGSFGMSVDKAGNLITKKGTVATTAETTAVLASTGAVGLKSLAVGVLTGELKLATAAHLLWSAAMKANPIGAVVALVTAFVGVIVAATKAIAKNDKKLQEIKSTTKKVSEETQELTSDIKESAEAYEANARSISTEAESAQTLLTKLEEVSAKEKKSKTDKELIKQYVDSLNSSVADLNLSYDEELDMLNMTEGAIKAKIEAYKEQAQAQASQERYVELLKEQQEVAAKLKETDDALNEATAKYNETSVLNLGVHRESKKAVEELGETKASLKEKEDELTESIKVQESTMEENAAKAAEASLVASEAMDTGVQKQITSLEDLEETQGSVVESLNTTWQSYKDQATNMFSTLSSESSISIEEMTENLLENQRIIGEWSNNIAILAKEGINEGLLEQLRQAGPESAGLAQTLVDGIESGKLAELDSIFSQNTQAATDAMKNVFDISDMSESVQGLVFKSEQSMQEAIAAADFGSIGHDAVTGYAEGIDEYAEEAATAAGDMVSDGAEAAQTAQDSHSPSKVYERFGRDAVAGYVLGVEGSQSKIVSAMKKAIESGMKAAESTSKTGMTSVAKATSLAFTNMGVSAKTGMSSMTSAVTSGMNSTSKVIDATMKQNTRSVTSGMNSMSQATTSGVKTQNTQVTTGFRQIQTTASSGMSAFVRAVSSGMSSSVSAVSSGKTQMVAQVNTLQDSFYNAGVYASQGLARGVNAGAGAAIAAARNVANSVAATMRSALQIHSPSRVTAEIGEYASEGAAAGLLNMLTTVQRASDKVAQVMVPQPSTASCLAYAGGYSGAAESYRGESVTIVVPVNLDGREIAKVITPYSEIESAKNAKLRNRLMGGR